MMERNLVKTPYNQPLVEQRADPYIYKHKDGYYYFTASVPEYDRIILRKSKTIKEIRNAKEHVIWRKHDSGEMSKNIWAPEIHYLNDAWYIYFAAGKAENQWDIRPYVLQCTDSDPVNGEWRELGKMQSADDDEFSFRAFSLDGTVFENNGTYYFVWAEKVGVGKKISNLYIAEMEKPWKLKSVQVMLSTPDYDWERKGFWVNEGPGILKYNDHIFLTYSASDTSANYCMGMLYAKKDSDLLDPLSWKKSRYPVLATDREKGIFGPGHNSFTKSEDGTKDIMLFHARQYEKISGDPLFDPNRHTLMMEIQWSDEGMPVFEYRKQVYG
nr:arabinofuranosidase [Xylanivirga thermophila]